MRKCTTSRLPSGPAPVHDHHHAPASTGKKYMVNGHPCAMVRKTRRTRRRAHNPAAPQSALAQRSRTRHRTPRGEHARPKTGTAGEGDCTTPSPPNSKRKRPNSAGPRLLLTHRERRPRAAHGSISVRSARSVPSAMATAFTLPVPMMRAASASQPPNSRCFTFDA